MRINGFRCDSCSSEHLIDVNHSRSAYMGEGLPLGWFIVLLKEKALADEEPLLFCSAKCLLCYAQKISEIA